MEKKDDKGKIEMILRLVIGVIVIYLLFKLIRKSFPAVGEKPRPTRIKTPDAGEELREDPQCHAYVPVSQAIRTEINGKMVYFCSRKCLEQHQKAG